MPKVITFTANLLAETTYEFSEWGEGRTVRAQRESFQVGGKGINVCKMLNRLGAENAALCFPGGEFGPMCESWLQEKGIKTLPFRTGCVTRSGAVVRSDREQETTFLGRDSIVSEISVREACEALDGIERPFVFAVCGSVQNWDSKAWDQLRDWVMKRPEGVKLLVDNYGPSLPWFTLQQPDLVKFNRDELELLFSANEREESTISLLSKARTRFGCDNWVVTNGGETVHLMAKSGAVQAFEPPQVECISPTGCGDVFFATLIDCLYNRSGYDLLNASKLAADYASRSAALPGIAEFEL